ncbi:unnamed protein product [Lepeophtheirus salmonis]|uniref:(salmon louse) hypothetical protein n=1 Tax=Lepeophtheirus salmonis TaxID=72036 RepID=A0A7R8D1I2_LEPSM|nr:unnamed protein product [Lepeophtheirus salmonis]CAF2995661.1 unnamed protein product [Lepeophtheirus salmonis]
MESSSLDLKFIGGKKKLKDNAISTHMTTKILQATAVAGLGHESNAKLNSGIPRFSNIVEGWYHGFQSLVNCAEPTIWNPMNTIRLEHVLIDNKICQHLFRKSPPSKKRKWIQFYLQLKTIIDDFDNNDLLDYVKTLGCVVVNERFS